MREPLRERLRRYGNLALDKIRRCRPSHPLSVATATSSANPSGTSAQRGSRIRTVPCPSPEPDVGSSASCRKAVSVTDRALSPIVSAPGDDSSDIRLSAGSPSLPAPYSEAGTSSQSAGAGSTNTSRPSSSAFSTSRTSSSSERTRCSFSMISRSRLTPSRFCLSRLAAPASVMPFSLTR